MRLEWRGFDPERLTAAYTSFAKHPQAINGQPYITSWNNKQARGYASADTNLHSSVYRSQMLDQEIEARIGGAVKIDLPGLVEAMGEAATTDLRAEKVLPLALRVIGRPAEPRMADAVAKLRAWVADGSHRRDRDGPGARRRNPRRMGDRRRRPRARKARPRRDSARRHRSPERCRRARRRARSSGTWDRSSCDASQGSRRGAA